MRGNFLPLCELNYKLTSEPTLCLQEGRNPELETETDTDDVITQLSRCTFL